MSCCGEEVRQQSRPIPDMEGLPDSTFCCMAKMAYNLMGTAEHFYAGRSIARWEWLLPAAQEEYALKARRALKAQPPKSEEPLEQLFYNLVRVVTSTV
jgi:hypothetical protein